MSLGLLITLITIVISGMKYFSDSAKSDEKQTKKEQVVVHINDDTQVVSQPQEIGQRSPFERQAISRATINEPRVAVVKQRYKKDASIISDANSPIFSSEDFESKQLVKNIILTEILSVPKSKR